MAASGLMVSSVGGFPVWPSLNSEAFTLGNDSL
jgi:hypothetical protein